LTDRKEEGKYTNRFNGFYLNPLSARYPGGEVLSLNHVVKAKFLSYFCFPVK
jgi:hypothetical protein